MIRKICLKAWLNTHKQGAKNVVLAKSYLNFSLVKSFTPQDTKTHCKTIGNLCQVYNI